MEVHLNLTAIIRTKEKVAISADFTPKERDFLLEAINECIDQAPVIKAERDELQQSFDLRWNADMRAIKRWQEAHPGNDLVWPDHADLCVWLLGELEKKP